MPLMQTPRSMHTQGRDQLGQKWISVDASNADTLVHAHSRDEQGMGQGHPVKVPAEEET